MLFDLSVIIECQTFAKRPNQIINNLTLNHLRERQASITFSKFSQLNVTLVVTEEHSEIVCGDITTYNSSMLH